MSIGLQTARVVIIDNVLGEAEGVMLALSDMGIGSIFLNGNIETLEPDRPKLEGIRLAFVDMHLADGDVSEEDQGALSARYLAAVLKHENSLIGVIPWTGNIEAVAAFKETLLREMPNAMAVVLDSVEKPPQRDPLEGAQLIKSALEKIVDAYTGLHFIWAWEQAVHEAATKSSSSLIEVVRRIVGVDFTNPKDVSDRVVEVLSALALAARERPAADGNQVASDSLAALLTVLHDSAEESFLATVVNSTVDWTDLKKAQKDFERRQENYYKKRMQPANFRAAREALSSHEKLSELNFIHDPESGDKVIEVGHKKKHLMEIFKDEHISAPDSVHFRTLGRLNRMVHVSRHRVSQDVLPGNVYSFAKSGPGATKFQELLGVSPKSLISNISKDITGRSLALIVEVSPACDIAQGKSGLPKLVAACLIEATNAGRIPTQTTYLYHQCGVLQFDSGDVGDLPEGEYMLILDARYQTGIPISTLLQWEPILRIRQNTLIDIQAWLARHGNRPGIITVVR